MALLPQSSLLLPSPLGNSSSAPQLPCGHSVPIPVGSTLLTHHPVGAQGASSLYKRPAGRKKTHPCCVCTDIHLWEEGKSCLISHAGWLPALQRDGQGYGLVLGLAGSETHREPQEEKSCSPCSSLAWQLCAQVCTDVFSWQVPPARAWLV